MKDGRIVEADVVISSLYRYYQESIVVRVCNKDGVLIKEFNTETDGESSKKQRKEAVNTWIKDNLDVLTGTFLETFDEVKKSGHYITEDDGSELTLESGQTSIYITYTKQQP